MPDDTCSNCKWWRRMRHGESYEVDENSAELDDEGVLIFDAGECFRFPPRISDRQLSAALDMPLFKAYNFGGSLPLSVIQHATLFPVTDESDFCGEFHPI